MKCHGTSWKNDSNSAGYAQSVRCVAFVSDCPKGSYENGSICSECTSKYTHCASCTAAECKSCESGYELNPYNNKCYKVIEDAFPVGNLYVTRLNMGDGGLPIPASVSIIDTSTGASCTSGKCCWKNKTATVCENKTSSENGGYSTCDRTVCNWYAADDICKSYSAGGKTWRLPNHTEAANWAVNTRTMGANGIQLCDSSTGIQSSNDFAPKCGDANGKCKGSGRCYPGYVWENSTTTTSASSGYLSNTSWRNTSRDKTYAQSVRCVTEIDYD